MIGYITVITAIAAIFAAIMIQLAAEPRFSAKLTGAMLVIAALGGVFLYGFGYTCLETSTPIAVVRGVLSVFGMFLGGMDFDVVEKTVLAAYPWIRGLFWFVHLAALYATASATIAAIGAEALKKLRLFLLHRGNLCIFYGVNPDAVDFARSLIAQTHDAVIFVDSHPDPACISSISQSGCLLRTDDAAISAADSFAKSIGIRSGSRKIALYALGYDGVDNLRYAAVLRDALERRKVKPEQTSLIILGVSDSAASALQTSQNRYGFGFVTVFQETDLVSRLLIRKFPPCNTVSFDETGTAAEDFEALVIGFGRLGQSVLRSLVMNGQFVGSHFRCTVFDPRCDSINGFLYSACEAMMSNYDIRLEPYDGRSRKLFSFLAENAGRLKYIVVSTNDTLLNREIAGDILQFFEGIGCNTPVYQCSHRGVLCSTIRTPMADEESIYSPDLLRYDQIDRLAMGINQTYLSGSTKTPLENWMTCDYFSRMSSRASADFFPAILRASGTSMEEILRRGWEPEGMLLENLGKMEHLRWCAFHFCKGYQLMSREEYAQRAAGYLEDVRNHRAPRRIGKNVVSRTHACLIPWEELDALSARENAVTGGTVDYKDMDIRNVLAIADILRDSKGL